MKMDGDYFKNDMLHDTFINNKIGKVYMPSIAVVTIGDTSLVREIINRKINETRKFNNWVVILKNEEQPFENKATISLDEAVDIVEKQIDEVEKFWGYYGDNTKMTVNYAAGRKMIREVFYSELAKKYNIY